MEFTGATRLIFGEYGSHASWEMDWASELRLAFVLPRSQVENQVELYLLLAGIVRSAIGGGLLHLSLILAL